LDLTPLGGNAIPEYPDQAKQEGIEGRFTLVLEVDRNGQVKSIKDTDSSQTTNFTLVESAKKTALQWKFKRTRGTTEYVNVPFTFVLDL
jgi:TonB family protein